MFTGGTIWLLTHGHVAAAENLGAVTQSVFGSVSQAIHFFQPNGRCPNGRFPCDFGLRGQVTRKSILAEAAALSKDASEFALGPGLSDKRASGDTGEMGENFGGFKLGAMSHIKLQVHLGNGIPPVSNWFPLYPC